MPQPTSNEEIKEFALQLLHADSEDDVLTILKEAEYWDDPSLWRLYGDKEGNFATIGAQQSRPEAALVEKLVNSVDTRLILECLKNKIEPDSPDAPQSIDDAVARFFEGKQHDGSIMNWSKTQRREEAEKITLAATGKRGTGRACFTISDLGEGQTPNKIPDTILSLNKSNKGKVRFVQGKFNMGGSGALRFCGRHSFQLVISKRNPEIAHLDSNDDSIDEWGVTIVRRRTPSGEPGDFVHSEFVYLAPIGNAVTPPEQMEILRFDSDSMPLMPKDKEPYARDIKWGTAMKLYDYELKTGRRRGAGAILMKDGLLYRLELLLPKIALPIRLHECRFKSWEPKSVSTSMEGLAVRLEDGKGDNLEDGFPDSVPFSVMGLPFTARIYAFKKIDGKKKAEAYRNTEGILFTINGQTHGELSTQFFTRKKVDMTRLSDSLMVIVECSALPITDREDLFMSSRDRLSKGALRDAIERELEDIIHSNSRLRELREKRRNSEISDRLNDSKPLEDVLKSLLKSSPTLNQLFLEGSRLNRPPSKAMLQAGKAGVQKGGGGGSNKGDKPFKGAKHPSYFKFKGKPEGIVLDKECQQSARCRISFETDVENEYFDRPDCPGQNDLVLDSHPDSFSSISGNLNLRDGVATLSLSVPAAAKPGEEFQVRLIVTDDTLQEPFQNTIKLKVQPPSKKKSGGKKKRTGTGSGSGKNEFLQGGLQLPEIIKVKQGQNTWEEHNFDEYTACKVISEQTGDDDQEEHTFYINVDNLYLKNEIKKESADSALIESQFIYGNVLFGLALIYQENQKDGTSADWAFGENGDNSVPLGKRIDFASRAFAPFLVPTVNYLGKLSPEEVLDLGDTSDED